MTQPPVAPFMLCTNSFMGYPVGAPFLASAGALLLPAAAGVTAACSEFITAWVERRRKRLKEAWKRNERARM